jgi:homoserine kinase type II
MSGFMAVYTVLNAKVISDILKKYDVGVLRRFEPISSGIENTNYFVWTESDDSPIQWVLTIFENLSEESLPFFTRLTVDLSNQGFAVPAPQKMKNSQFVFSINYSLSSSMDNDQLEHKKYGVLVPKFEGVADHYPDVSKCRKIAIYTAKMHSALNDFESNHSVQHSLEWCEHLVGILSPLIPQDDAHLLRLALARYYNYKILIEQCSEGIVHGDLFRDNVLFEKNEISGVIDFYNAGSTAFLFDLAVIANDWAVNFDQLPALFSKSDSAIDDVDLKAIYNEQKLTALIGAYESEKHFSQAEREAWPRLLELAAFRFWLSRLKTKYVQSYQQASKAGEVIKSPEAMKVILLAAIAR